MLKFASRLDPQWVRRIAATAPPPWGPLGYFVYKRTYAQRVQATGLTEQWHETLERYINAVLEVGGRFTHDEAKRLFMYGYLLKAMPGGRVLWQLGTPTMYRLGGDSACNCWYVHMKHWEDLCFAFNASMLGGGVGFRASGECLPVVYGGKAVRRVERGGNFIVPDTREGWVDLLRRVYRCYFENAPSFTYSTELVRPKNAPIRGFGGVASGPEPLCGGVAKICGVLDRLAGRRPSSVDVVDLHTLQGEVVVSGNVRRSALIGIGDGTDVAYLQAKRWDLGTVPGWRGLVNLTCEVDDVRDLAPEYWHGWETEGEQFGLFNGRLIRETDPFVQGCNPCGEANLVSHEPCDLAELVMPNLPSVGEFHDAAVLLYRAAKTVLQLPFIHPETQRVVRENQRIGIGVTGVRGSRFADDEYRAVYSGLRAEDRRYSREIHANESVKLTVVKPSGTLSLLAGVQPGIHGDVSAHYVRRVRIASGHPLAVAAAKNGYYVEPARDHNGVIDPRTDVVSFVVKGGIRPGGALEQMDLHRRMQRVWADQSVSVTVGFDQAEVPSIRARLEEGYRTDVKTISFMRNSGHGFVQSPYEPISADLYRHLSRGLVPLTDVETRLEEDAPDQSLECAGGVCPVR